MLFLHQGGHMPAAPRELQNRWFTHFLYGVENGVEQEAKAWVVREGQRPNNATKYADYPHPETKMVAVFPQGGGNGLGVLGTAPKADAGRESLVDDPKLFAKQLAKALPSENRLLYALPKLTAPLHLSGKVRVTLRLAADRPACNLSVYLVSLPWTDSKRATEDLVTRGWADPQNHKALDKGEPLVPGTFVDVVFDLQPDDQILAAGEQLALMVFATDREFTLLPSGGTKLTLDLAGTKFELPIIGGAEALAKATAPAPATEPAQAPATGGDGR
jgi:X-Pro dipeptidyl-peptidase